MDAALFRQLAHDRIGFLLSAMPPYPISRRHLRTTGRCRWSFQLHPFFSKKYVFPYHLAFFVRSLTIVGKPLALRHCHIGEGCLEGGILRAASINAEADFSATMPHMTNTHLSEMLPIGGTLDTIVILPAAEAIPHGLDGSVNGGSCPVGVTVVGDYTAQMLKAFVL